MSLCKLENVFIWQTSKSKKKKKKKKKKESGQDAQSKINSQIYFESLCDVIITTFSGGPVLKIAETSKRWDIYVHEVCREHSSYNSRWLTDYGLRPTLEEPTPLGAAAYLWKTEILTSRMTCWVKNKSVLSMEQLWFFIARVAVEKMLLP